MLTPLDLNNKNFSKGFRGYDTEEVDEFFAKVAKDFERLYQDNVELKDAVERVSAKLEYYQQMESTMQNTLVIAQETADEVKKNSEQKAALLEQETAMKCKEITSECQAAAAKAKMDAEIAATQARTEAEAYAEKLRSEAESETTKLRNDTLAEIARLRGEAEAELKQMKNELSLIHI